MSTATRFSKLCSVVAILWLLGVTFARLPGQVYKAALPSTAWILSPIGDESGKTAEGTGVLIDVPNRLLLTAYHVVEKRQNCVVFFPSFDADGNLQTAGDAYTSKIEERGIRGTVIVCAEDKDLAIIQLEKLPALAKAMPLSASSPEPGDVLHAIGNSGSDIGALWRYRQGTVRQVFSRQFVFSTLQLVHARVVEAQMPTNPGDSGGPMFTSRGELVAITSNRTSNDSLVDYGIDIQEVQKLVFEKRSLREICAGTPALLLAPGSEKPKEPASPGVDPYSLFNLLNPLTTPNPETPLVPEITPAARINNVRADHAVTRGGRLGVEMIVEVEVDGLKGASCDVVLTVCTRDGRALLPGLLSSRTPNHQLGTSTPVVPIYDYARISNITLFFAYDEITTVTTEGSAHYRLAVDVHAGTRLGFLNKSTWWEELVRNY